MKNGIDVTVQRVPVSRFCAVYWHERCPEKNGALKTCLMGGGESEIDADLSGLDDAGGRFPRALAGRIGEKGPGGIVMEHGVSAAAVRRWFLAKEKKIFAQHNAGQ